MADNYLHGRTIAQGASFGLADEAEAWAREKLGLLPKGTTQETARRQIMADVEAYREANPYSAATQEFAGGVIPGALAGLFTGGGGALPTVVGPLSRLRTALTTVPSKSVVKQGAKVGAITGGIGGAGAAEPGGRIEGAIGGVTGGTILGGGLPIVANLGKRGISAVKDFALPASARSVAARAARKLNEQLVGQNKTVQDLMTAAKENYLTYGVPSLLAHELPGAMEAITRKSGILPEATQLEKELLETQTGAGGRVMEQFRTRLNPKSWADTEETLTSTLRADAKPLYEKAYAYGPVDDPRILAALKDDPVFKKAFKEAKKIADSEASAAKLRGEDPTPYMLQDLYKPIEKQPGVFDVELTTVPDIRTLDYVKRGLDSLVEQGYKGKGMSSARAKSVKESRNAFVDILDNLSPEYKAARAKYAGDAEVLDALREGNANFAKTKYEDIGKMFKTMSDAEKDAYRVGAIRQLEDRIMKGRGNAAGMLVQDKLMDKRIESLFDNASEYKLFKAALEREAQLYDVASRSLSGSRTDIKRVLGEQLETEAGIIGPEVPDLVGGGLSQKALNFMRGDQKLPPEVLDKVANMLRAGSPDEVAAVVKMLESQKTKDLLLGKTTRAATLGAISGTSGGTAVPDVSAEVSGGDLILNELLNYYTAIRAPSESGK